MLGKFIGDSYPAAWTGPLAGIDWGERRIGIAVSDAMLRFSERLAIIESRNSLSKPMRYPHSAVNKIRNILQDHDIKGLVFGVPWYHLSGDTNPKAESFVLIGKFLGERLLLPVYFWDEGLTTDEIRGQMKVNRPDRHRLLKPSIPVDDHAAALLLQSFLDERINSPIRY